MFQENIHNKIKAELKNMTNITYMSLTSRGNTAIKKALETAKKLGKTECIMLDQGGWITYPQFAQEVGLKVKYIETNACEIDLNNLENSLTKKSVFIIHSLSGYFYKQPMEKIYTICKIKGAMLINDCSGSISCFDLIYGDIFVCSFGKWKPLNHGTGGFIGTRDSPLFYKDIQETDFEIERPEELLKIIERVSERTTKINQRSQKIIADLESKQIKIHAQNKDMTLVVLAEYKKESEKEEIISYCQKNNLEFVECPRDIRIKKPAISIEVKRLNI